MTRQDIHSPKRFVPEDYSAIDYLDNKRPVFVPPFGAFAGFDMEAACEQHKAEVAAWQAEILRYFPGWRTGGEDHTSIHRCNHCGAHIRWVVVVEHGPTGNLLAFGEICASERIGIPIDEFKMRALQSAAAKRAKAAKRIERREKARQERREAFASEQPALDRPPEILPPAGRREIDAKVISTKWQESDYGDTLKMLVEVQNGGRYRLWGTVPRALSTVDRGDEITFRATIQPKERGFGFFSRPTA